MKKNLFTFAILLIAFHLTAQKYAEKDIVGKWKVIKISKAIENPNLNGLLKSFKSATFEFKENSDFKITTSDKNELFTMFTDMTNNSKWKLDRNKFALSIGNESNGYNILKIIVVEVNNKFIFHLSETELDLEVVKE